MSLTFFKNNKPDNRMVEYDQAIVRLGLEKAELEREWEKKRREVREISIAVDLVRAAFLKDRKELTEEKMKEIDKQSGVLMDYEKQVADEKKKFDDLVLKQKQVLDSISKSENERTLLLESIEKHGELNVSLIKTSNSLVEDKQQKDRERNNATALLREILREKNKAVSELQELNIKKSESEHALEKANNDLAELNEIISILQASNKEGLDVTVSFEGERKRLREKEEFLIRKGEDLVLYEKRVEKRAKELGVDIKMRFK